MVLKEVPHRAISDGVDLKPSKTSSSAHIFGRRRLLCTVVVSAVF